MRKILQILTINMLKSYGKLWNKKSWLLSWFVQIDTLLIADAFENVQNKCIETYELGLLSAPGLLCETC